MKLSETFNVGDIFQDDLDNKEYNRILKIKNDEYLNVERVKINEEKREIVYYNTFTIDSNMCKLNQIVEYLGHKVDKIPDIIKNKNVILYIDKYSIVSLLINENKKVLTNISLSKDDLISELEIVEIKINNFEHKYVFNWDKIEFELEKLDYDISDQFSC